MGYIDLEIIDSEWEETEEELVAEQRFREEFEYQQKLASSFPRDAKQQAAVAWLERFS